MRNVPSLAYVPSPLRNSSRRERTKSCIRSQSYLLFFTTGTYQVLHTFPVLSVILHDGTEPSLAYVPSPIAILHDWNVPSLAYAPSPIRYSSRLERTKSCIRSQSYPLFFTTGTYQVLHSFPVLSAILHDGNEPSLA